MFRALVMMKPFSASFTYECLKYIILYIVVLFFLYQDKNTLSNSGHVFNFSWGSLGSPDSVITK